MAVIWKGTVARAFDPAGFAAYVGTLAFAAWKPSRIILHNTAAPSLAQRPAGFTAAHMRNLVTWYRDTNKWSAGPHLFVDDRQIWVFTPLEVRGVHSPSFNSTAIGLEMLGDFAREPFAEGRGAEVRDLSVAAISTLNRRLGLSPETLKLHREDPKTTHACPGAKVDKADMIARIRAAMGAGR